MDLITPEIVHTIMTSWHLTTKCPETHARHRTDSILACYVEESIDLSTASWYLIFRVKYRPCMYVPSALTQSPDRIVVKRCGFSGRIGGACPDTMEPSWHWRKDSSSSEIKLFDFWICCPCTLWEHERLYKANWHAISNHGSATFRVCELVGHCSTDSPNKYHQNHYHQPYQQWHSLWLRHIKWYFVGAGSQQSRYSIDLCVYIDTLGVWQQDLEYSN